MQLNYFGYFNSTGYSISAQDYILSMLHVNPSLDIRVNIINHKIGDGISKNRRQIFTALKNKSPSEPMINLYHSIPIRYHKDKSSNKHIGFCVFETINPPPDWISHMNNMDMILTASEFNKNVFEHSGVKVPIHVIPHCFCPKMFNNKVRPNGRFEKTTFISIGTWKKRKNWEALIKSWYAAFEIRHDVCLLIKTDKPDELKNTVHQIKQNSEWRSKSTAPIYCENTVNCDFEDIPSFMMKGDIYISASLGEGFGIAGLHAMALGLPVVTTRFGGCLEYAKPEYCTYFEPNKYQTISNMDGISQLSNCIWPRLSIEEIAGKLHEVFHGIKEREQKAQNAYKFVHENFSYDAIGNKFLQTLEIQ